MQDINVISKDHQIIQEISPLSSTHQQDDELIREIIKLIDLQLEKLNISFKGASVGYLKESHFHPITHIISVEHNLPELFEKYGAGHSNSKTSPRLQWMVLESIFDNAIEIGMIRNAGYLDSNKFMNTVTHVIEDKIQDLFSKISGAIFKMYRIFIEKYSMFNNGGDLEDIKTSNSKTFSLVSTSDFNDVYTENVVESISK